MPPVTDYWVESWLPRPAATIADIPAHANLPHCLPELASCGTCRLFFCFPEHPHHFLHECGEIHGPARGDKVSVNNDILVQINASCCLDLIGNAVGPV